MFSAIRVDDKCIIYTAVLPGFQVKVSPCQIVPEVHSCFLASCSSAVCDVSYVFVLRIPCSGQSRDNIPVSLSESGSRERSRRNCKLDFLLDLCRLDKSRARQVTFTVSRNNVLIMNLNSSN